MCAVVWQAFGECIRHISSVHACTRDVWVLFLLQLMVDAVTVVTVCVAVVSVIYMFSVLRSPEPDGDATATEILGGYVIPKFILEKS